MNPPPLIEHERLAFLPPKYWHHHEFCFFLHDQLVQLLAEYEQSGSHRWVAEAFEKVLKERGTTAGEVDILDFLKAHSLVSLYKHHIVSHLVLGLTSDLLHFLYEALRCFEKRKFAVAFSLLRKPLKENLLFLAWLLGNEDDFLSRFEKNNYTTLNGVTPERRKEYFADAISRLPTKEAFAADLLEDLIYSKTNIRSFEPTWQRASHLITSQGATMRTEDLNINFIFNDASADGLYDLLYANLPYVLLYATHVVLECFARVMRANELTTSHLILSSLGAFECLFERKPKVGVTAMLGRHLKPFLKCLHCSSSIRLSSANAVSMYLQEVLQCHKCKLASPFPLYWLFAQANIKISRDDTKSLLEEITDDTERTWTTKGAETERKDAP